MAHPALPRTSPLRMKFPKVVTTGTALVASAVALVGAGTYAAWTSTSTSTTGSISSANVVHAGADANSTTFTTALINMLPADYLYRYRTITNSGSVAQTFTGAVSSSGVLAGAGGLTVIVDTCTVAWTTVATVSTCTGATTNLLASTGVSTSPPIAYGSLAAAGVEYVRYTFGLPSAASQSTFNNTSGTVTVAVTGTAGAGSDRTTG